ncbi:MAG: hypothetical protein NVSMB62_02440 [Acidobacteriaceae bacterium]
MKFLPAIIGRFSRTLGLVLLLGVSSTAAVARDPLPAKRIPLNPIGYQPILPEFLAAGSAMATLHYVDANHILVTFGLRHLMKRDVNDPPEDADRTIGAFLIDLASGKVVAKTEWRLHDRGQYLWDLGDGRLLLRIREQLSVIEPAYTLSPEDALRQRPLLHSTRRIVSIGVSAEHDLLTVQTVEQAPVVILADAPAAAAAHSPILVSFYRLLTANGKLTVSSAGVVRSAAPLALPVNTGGFLDTIEGTHSRFNFRFNTGKGTPTELGDWDSSCVPRSTFVSRSEFVSFGCRGGPEHQTIAGFNLGGNFMWQQNFYEPHVNPDFVFAPAAGRFALGRTIVTPGANTFADLTPAQITTQEVRVYQTYNGKIVLRVTCTPAMRAGQNFALSPDGMHLAVLRETAVPHQAKDEPSRTSQDAAVEIYDLPALSRQDETAVAEARRLAPPDTGLRVDETMKPVIMPANATAATADTPATRPKGAGDSSTAPENPPPVSTGATAAAESPAVLPPNAATQQMTQEGDIPAEDGSRRNPPTLYAPEEKRPGSKAGQSTH